MSGVFGVAAPHLDLDLHKPASQMGTAMMHQPWYVVDTHVDQAKGLSIGRIGFGIYNQTAQPVWNTDHTIVLVMAGEFYDTSSNSSPDIPQSPEQFALNLYQEIGLDFVHRIAGSSVMVLWNQRAGQLFIINDRYGTHPAHDQS